MYKFLRKYFPNKKITISDKNNFLENNEYLKEDNNLEYSVEAIDNLYHLILKGKAAHAMEPHKGINGGTHMCNFLKDYSNNKMEGIKSH